MKINIKLLIAFFSIVALLILKEIQYVNLLFKDKFWIFAIANYILLLVLILPANVFRFKKEKLLLIFFLFGIILLLVFTLFPVNIFLELFGAVLYILLWFLLIYKIMSLLKSSESD